jgi:hypothetical protein
MARNGNRRESTRGDKMTDKDKYPTAVEGQTVNVGTKENPFELPQWADTHKFTVPDNERTKQEFPDEIGKETVEVFTYGHIELDSEASDEDRAKAEELAISVMKARKWSIREFVNEELKSLARSSSYQAKLAPYLPIKTTSTPEQIRARMIKDFERSGYSYEQAKQFVDTALANAPKG